MASSLSLFVSYGRTINRNIPYILVSSHLVNHLLRPNLLFQINNDIRRNFHPTNQIQFFRRGTILPTTRRRVHATIKNNRRRPTRRRHLRRRRTRGFMLHQRRRRVHLPMSPLRLVLKNFFLPRSTTFRPLFPSNHFRTIRVLHITITSSMGTNIQITFPRFNRRVRRRRKIPPKLSTTSVRRPPTHFLHPRLLLGFHLPNIQTIARRLPISTSTRHHRLLQQRALFRRRFPNRLTLNRGANTTTTMTPRRRNIRRSTRPIVILIRKQMMKTIMSRHLFKMSPHRVP